MRAGSIIPQRSRTEPGNNVPEVRHVLFRLWKNFLVWPFLIFLLWNLVVRIVRRIYKFPMPHFMADLIDNPWRRKIQPPDRLARWHGLRPGMTVLDVGPGNGTYTLAAARQVGPTGKVFAVDIEPAMIKRVQRKIAAQDIQNLDARVGDVYALPFPTQSMDAATMITVIGEIPDPVHALRELFRLLRPGGTIAFSELLPDPDYPLPGTIKRWASAAGFAFVECRGNVFAYTLLFRKPAGGQPLIYCD